MSHRRRVQLGIGAKLAIAIALMCMATGILIGLLSLRSYRQAVEHEVVASLDAVATITASSMRQWHTSLERTIEGISRRTELEELTHSLLAESSDPLTSSQLRSSILKDHLANVVAEQHLFTSLTVTNATTGIISVSTDPERLGKFNLGIPVIEDPFQGATAGAISYNRAKQTLEMLVSAPIQADGRVIAVLSGEVDLSALEQLISSPAGLGVDESIYLVDQMHFFITEPPGTGGGYALQRTVRTEGVERALLDGSYVGRYLDYREVPVWGASRWLEDWNLVLVVEKDLNVALVQVRRLQRIVVVIVAICVVGFAALGGVIARSLTKPVRLLTTAAKHLGRGDFSHRIDWSGRDELGRLSQTFNQMIENLQTITASRDDLNEEIQLRSRAEGRLRHAIQELRRSNEELEQFAYVASHDLQEPLRMVASYTELIEKRYSDSLDKDGQTFVRYAVDGAMRMQRLIQDLLAFSRVQSRGKRFESVHMDEVVIEAMSLLQARIDETRARVTQTALPIVQGDAAQLVQLMQNLIGNAMKFCEEKAPHIHISADETESEFRFEVADNGIGIKEEFAERVFVIFERLHGRRKYPGTGIGLAICKRIVERHGGQIRAESRSSFGSGATIVFTLAKNPREFNVDDIIADIDKR